MSPKESSLAYEDIEEQLHTDHDDHFAPQLNVLVKNKFSSAVTQNEVFEISGRLTISF